MAEGRIIKAVSGFYYVQSGDNVYACKGRGLFRKHKVSPLVGDYVKFDITTNNEGYIQEIAERKNELIRPPIANVSQAIIVSSAVQPTLSTVLIDRFLVLVEAKRIKPIIVITKKDLATEDEIERVSEFAQKYEQIGYDVSFVALNGETSDTSTVENFLTDEVTVVIGQSGVGKSTLLNVLHPELAIKTGEVSLTLGRGKHTTRHVELMEVAGGLVADTPGFSSLDFAAIEAHELSAYFIEMSRLRNQCRFRGCLHDREPGCAVKAALDEGTIETFRYENYLTLLKEIQNRKPRY